MIRAAVVGLTALALLISVPARQLPQAGAALPQHAVLPSGFNALHFILREVHHLELLSSIDKLRNDPANSLLIVLGDTHAGQAQDAASITKDFLNEGGALLLATDQNSNQDFDKVLGVTVLGERITAVKPACQYRKMESCPLVTEFDTEQPIFQGLTKIATNLSGHVRRTRNHQRGLTFYPESCLVNDKKPEQIPAFAALLEKRRVVVLADHSVFINCMMLQRDNDNFAFACNCIDWLKDEKRTQVLLIDNGRIVTEYDIPLWPGTLPELKLPDDLPAHPVDIFNSFMAWVEDENLHNEELLLKRFSIRDLVRGGVIPLATLLLLGFGLYRIQQGRHQTEPGA